MWTFLAQGIFSRLKITLSMMHFTNNHQFVLAVIDSITRKYEKNALRETQTLRARWL